MFPLGDYDTTETVHIPFNTFSSDDPSASVTITDLVAGDIEIHKDGAVAQRTSDNGVTISINFDGVTGNHMAHIDLSDNSDAGFYAAGSRYQVRIEGTTVDGATINAWIGTFSIGCTLRPAVMGVAGSKLGSIPWNAAWDAEVESEVDDALGAAGSALTALPLNDPTVASMADGVWNETMTNHVSAGMAGEQLWTDVDAILADTDNLPADPADDSDIDSQLSAIASQLSGLNDVSAANINSQMMDVLETDTHAPPGQEAPASTQTLAKMIAYLYKVWRNKQDQASSNTNYYADDGSTVDQKRATSEAGGVVTDAEVVSGA